MEDTFAFCVNDQVITPSRYVKRDDNEVARADMEDDPTVVPLRRGMTLALRFTIVKLSQPRPLKVFFFAEMGMGSYPTLKKFVESPRHLCPEGLRWRKGTLPFMSFPALHAVHFFLPEGTGIVPTFCVVHCEPGRDHRRHFLIGDLWEDRPWIHTVKVDLRDAEAEHRHQRPRRASAHRGRL